MKPNRIKINIRNKENKEIEYRERQLEKSLDQVVAQTLKIGELRKRE